MIRLASGSFGSSSIAHLDASFGVGPVEIREPGAGANPHRPRTSEIAVSIDSTLKPVDRLAQVFIDDPAQPVVGEPAQVKIECGHRLGFRPSRGRNVVFLNTAQHRGSNTRDHVIEAVDKTLKAVIEPIAPHHAAGFGFGERQIDQIFDPSCRSAPVST